MKINDSLLLHLFSLVSCKHIYGENTHFKYKHNIFVESFIYFRFLGIFFFVSFCRLSRIGFVCNHGMCLLQDQSIAEHEIAVIFKQLIPNTHQTKYLFIRFGYAMSAPMECLTCASTKAHFLQEPSAEKVRGRAAELGIRIERNFSNDRSDEFHR